MVESIQEEILMAEAAAEPGTHKAGEVVHEGDEEVPVELTALELKSAGWVYVYDMRSGEPSLCNRNMLHQVLRFTENGKRVFTTQKPAFSPKRGTHKCLLHPDHPMRSHFDDLGLPVCMKSNLRSPYQVELHMRKRHKAEWETIQKERQDAEKAEDRQLQRSMVSAMTARASEGQRVEDLGGTAAEEVAPPETDNTESAEPAAPKPPAKRPPGRPPKKAKPKAK